MVKFRLCTHRLIDLRGLMSFQYLSVKNTHVNRLTPKVLMFRSCTNCGYLKCARQTSEQLAALTSTLRAELVCNTLKSHRDDVLLLL